jgi:Fic family protein
MARAIYMMFLCSEVYPFNDGNGRVARIMMNAELVKGNQTRINYLLSLRKLSRNKEPSALLKVLDRLQLCSDNLYGDDFDELNDYLVKCNAFEEPERGKLNIIERTFKKVEFRV